MTVYLRGCGKINNNCFVVVACFFHYYVVLTPELFISSLQDNRRVILPHLVQYTMLTTKRPFAETSMDVGAQVTMPLRQMRVNPPNNPPKRGAPAVVWRQSKHPLPYFANQQLDPEYFPEGKNTCLHLAVEKI